MRPNRFRSFSHTKTYAEKRRVPCHFIAEEEEEQKEIIQKDDQNKETKNEKRAKENKLKSPEFMPFQFQDNFDDFQIIEDKEPSIDFFIDYNGKDDNFDGFEDAFEEQNQENLFFNDNFNFW